MKNKRTLIILLLGLMAVVLGGCIQRKEIEIESYKQYKSDTSDKNKIVEEQEEEIVASDSIEVDIQQSDKIYEFYYNELNEQQKAVYTELLNGIKNRKDSVYINKGSMAQDDITNIFAFVKFDHPELFYATSNYQHVAVGDNQLILMKYMSAEETELNQQRLDDWTELAFEKAKEDLKGALISGEATKEDSVSQTYIIERSLYDFICESTIYDIEAEDNQSLISVLNGRTVCLGYSKAFKYLCDRAGIDNFIVYGITNDDNGNHSWNKVLIDDNWYVVDITNSGIRNEEVSDGYDMFNITDEIQRITSAEKGSYTDNIVITYPKAESTKYDYYNQCNKYVDTIEDFNKLIDDYVTTENGKLIIRFSDNCSVEEIRTAMDNIYSNDNIKNKSISFVTTERKYVHLYKVKWQVN